MDLSFGSVHKIPDQPVPDCLGQVYETLPGNHGIWRFISGAVAKDIEKTLFV